MKQIIITILLVLGLASPAISATRDLGQRHKVVYHILDGAGDHVGGQTVSLSIQRMSNEDWYDFNDSSFKSSGWSNKTNALTDDSTNGMYHYIWTPPGSETSENEYIFLVDNADGTYGDHQSELVSYLDFTGLTASDVTLIKAALNVDDGFVDGQESLQGILDVAGGIHLTY